MLFLEGNVIDCLRSLPEQSVHCVITMPFLAASRKLSERRFF